MEGHKFIFHGIVEYDKDADSYSAVCLENNVASLGDTPEEAFHNLQEAVRLYVCMRIKNKQFDMLVRPARKEFWDKFFRKGSHLHPKVKKIVETVGSSFRYELSFS